MFRKWELVNELKLMTRRYYNPLFGYTRAEKVLVNVYRKKGLNGMYKYKYKDIFLVG